MPRDSAARAVGRPSPPQPPEGDPDDALIARVAAGDSSAWPELVERHLNPVWSYARRLLDDAAEAEDVAQETFVRLMRKAESWQPGGARLTTWLHRVATNLCIDRRRAKAPLYLEDVPAQPDPAQDGEAVAGQKDTARTVNAALADLPERQRAALVLTHYQGLSNGEAADLLDTTVEAVESLLARGRRTLRQRMAPMAPDLLET